MIFFNFYQTLVDKQAIVTVEMKNDVQLTGTLESVDQFLNVKLSNVKVKEESKYPHLACLKSCFVRGSVVRYIHLKATDVDTAALQDRCRKEAKDETR